MLGALTNHSIRAGVSLRKRRRMAKRRRCSLKPDGVEGRLTGREATARRAGSGGGGRRGLPPGGRSPRLLLPAARQPAAPSPDAHLALSRASRLMAEALRDCRWAAGSEAPPGARSWQGRRVELQGVSGARTGVWAREHFPPEQRRDNPKPPAPATSDARKARLRWADVTRRRKRPSRWAGLAKLKVGLAQ